MVTINLAKAWTYRTPQKTIDYPAGEHAVHKYIAEQAVTDGAIEAFEEASDGDTDQPAKTGKKGAAGGAES